MPCKSKCHYKEERIPGQGGCFLSLPGPEATCNSFQPPPVINPPPLDAEIAEKFKEIDWR